VTSLYSVEQHEMVTSRDGQNGFLILIPSHSHAVDSQSFSFPFPCLGLIFIFTESRRAIPYSKNTCGFFHGKIDYSHFIFSILSHSHSQTGVLLPSPCMGIGNPPVDHGSGCGALGLVVCRRG